MKRTMNRTGAVLAVVLMGLAAGLASAATATGTPAARGHWHAHHSSMVGTLLRATHQLNLSADQQQTIKSLVASARKQQFAARAGAPDLTVLGNPAHPDYATALQSAKAAATSRIDSEAALQAKIYDVLTTEQRAQLPQVLAGMKAKMEQRRAAWQQRNAASS